MGALEFRNEIAFKPDQRAQVVGALEFHEEIALKPDQRAQEHKRRRGPPQPLNFREEKQQAGEQSKGKAVVDLPRRARAKPAATLGLASSSPVTMPLSSLPLTLQRPCIPRMPSRR